LATPCFTGDHSPRPEDVQSNIGKRDDYEDANIDIRDIYRAQWKRVQFLSNLFWQKWKREYLNTLSPRKKWTETVPNIVEGSVVLLKDKETVRRHWPLARVSEVLPSEDGKIRKVIVTVFKDGKKTKYERPITEMVLLTDCE
jgi:hypothetical protein